ncbi:MAG TPA: hypothetical protein VK626_02165 [Nitrospiraceae bacterium]|jgi:FMN phosphatase YigB (HAD superfamily)|nr:hypothetical protein [Nitrospiraceae bacterium]
MGFLFDIDNTLLDNDRITDDLRCHLEPTVGHDRQETYWAIFERLRTELVYADFLSSSAWATFRLVDYDGLAVQERA